MHGQTKQQDESQGCYARPFSYYSRYCREGVFSENPDTAGRILIQ